MWFEGACFWRCRQESQLCPSAAGQVDVMLHARARLMRTCVSQHALDARTCLLEPQQACCRAGAAVFCSMPGLLCSPGYTITCTITAKRARVHSCRACAGAGAVPRSWAVCAPREQSGELLAEYTMDAGASQPGCSAAVSCLEWVIGWTRAAWPCQCLNICTGLCSDLARSTDV